MIFTAVFGMSHFSRVLLLGFGNAKPLVSIAIALCPQLLALVGVTASVGAEDHVAIPLPCVLMEWRAVDNEE
jgi:hypothetical protein